MPANRIKQIRSETRVGSQQTVERASKPLPSIFRYVPRLNFAIYRNDPSPLLYNVQQLAQSRRY